MYVCIICVGGGVLVACGLCSTFCILHCFRRELHRMHTLVEECPDGESLSRGPVDPLPFLQLPQPLPDMTLVQSFIHILYN